MKKLEIEENTVGDYVLVAKIKDIDWFVKNKNQYGVVKTRGTNFTQSMEFLCGLYVIIWYKRNHEKQNIFPEFVLGKIPYIINEDMVEKFYTIQTKEGIDFWVKLQKTLPTENVEKFVKNYQSIIIKWL